MPSPTEITVSQLSRLIGVPDCPVLIDVRIDADFDDDPHLIPTAFRYPFAEVEALASALKGQRVVVYCQKGKKISQGAAALLRLHDICAETLEGGQFAWRDAGEWMVSVDPLPGVENLKETVWVTRHRPKIDRIACPWLIRRFIDPNAKFLFVSPSEAFDVADKFGAIPFDVEGVFWGHRGEGCTFDTMLEAFGLQSEPLLHLAGIIRGADTERLDLTPQSSGLLAASLGFSRMYKNDVAQLDATMSLYDSLYRWCRDATDETHDWTSHVRQSS